MIYFTEDFYNVQKIIIFMWLFEKLKIDKITGEMFLTFCYAA